MSMYNNTLYDNPVFLPKVTPMTSPVPESGFMQDSSSYHGPISGKEAVKRLRKGVGDSYLTRFSPNHSYYVLTVLRREPSMVVGNFQLIINTSIEHYSVQGMERSFSSMDELLGYYEAHRIHPMFDTIGRRLTVHAYTNLAQKWSCVVQ